MKPYIIHTKEQQENLIKQHKKLVCQYKKTGLGREEIHNIHNKIMDFISLESYKQFAVDRCRFHNSDLTERKCEGKIKQSLKHYSVHGNCCTTCDNLYYQKANLCIV